MAALLDFDREVLAEFCRAHGIRKLSVFGSVLHGTNGPDSDLDLLVEFEPNTRIGLIGFAGIQVELSDLLGRQVDLNTAQDLSRYFRATVLAEAEVLYARAA
jgi:predicted nucleotidyltransferase